MRLSKNFKLGTVAILCLVMVFASVVSVSAATTYSAKTEYTGTSSDSKVTVTATAANVAKDDIVTYVAYTGDSVATGSIVYIDQEKSEENGSSVSFEYSTSASNLNQTKLFGGKEGGVGKYPVEDDPTDTTAYYSTTVNIVYTNGDGYIAPKTIKYVPYAEDVTPYNVARIFDISGAAGTVNKIKVSKAGGSEAAEVENYIINSEGEVTMYTDLINETGLVITVEMSGQPTPMDPILGGIEADSCTIQAKVHYHAGDEYGIMVTKGEYWPNEFYHVGDDVAISETNAILFPALGLNGDGVFAVELQGLEAGTYRFAVYQGDTAEMSSLNFRRDTTDLNKQEVTYTVE